MKPIVYTRGQALPALLDQRIAILDGARAVGFDIADLEGELEKSLGDIERRTGPKN